MKTEQYNSLYQEMRSIVKSPDGSMSHLHPITCPMFDSEIKLVDGVFFAVYLHIKGKDWKRGIDITCLNKIEQQINRFQYFYPAKQHKYWLLTPESKKVFDGVKKSILEELQLLKRTFS